MALHRPKIVAQTLATLRERCLMTAEDAAHFGGFSSVERYLKVESGERYPTKNQVDRLAKRFDVPVWYFFLEDIEEDEMPIPSFRRRPTAPSRDAYLELAAVREAARRRQITLDTLADLGEEAPTFDAQSNVATDPEVAARYVRDVLNIRTGQPASFRNSDQAYLALRVAVEAAGVLVFHFSLPSISGFALFEPVLPIIGVSTSERSGTARQFTLAHELGHIALRDSAIHSASTRYSAAEEEWCNRFAGALLVSAEDLAQSEEVASQGRDAIWTKGEITRLAGVFHVSPSMLARRLRDTGYMLSDVADNLIPELDTVWASVRRESVREESGDPMYYDVNLAAWGYYAPSVIEQGYSCGVIAEADLPDIIGAKVSTSLEFMRRVAVRPRNAFH